LPFRQNIAPFQLGQEVRRIHSARLERSARHGGILSWWVCFGKHPV